MPDMPEFDQSTLNAAMRSLERMMDNEDYGDNLLEIAEKDQHYPHLDIPDDEDLSIEQEDANTEFTDALDTLITARFAADRNPLIRDLLDMIRNELQAYNAPDMLGGYLNTLIADLNSIYAQLDIAPITPEPDDDLTTD